MTPTTTPPPATTPSPSAPAIASADVALNTTGTRLERDSLGEVPVPAAAL